MNTIHFHTKFCCKKQKVIPVCLLPNSLALNVFCFFFFTFFFHKNHDLSFASIWILHFIHCVYSVYHASCVKDIKCSFIRGYGIANIFHSWNVVVIFFDNCCYFVLISNQKIYHQHHMRIRALSQEVTELSEFLCCIISNLFVCSVLNIFNFIFSVIRNSVLFNSFSSSASSRCVAHRV